MREPHSTFLFKTYLSHSGFSRPASMPAYYEKLIHKINKFQTYSLISNQAIIHGKLLRWGTGETFSFSTGLTVCLHLFSQKTGDSAQQEVKVAWPLFGTLLVARQS
jgi:hypothetical protein